MTISGDVKASKLLERAPEKVQELVSHLTKDGPVENAYISVEAFTEYYQSVGQDPRAMAEQVTGSAEAYDQAMAAGHDLVIPMGSYARYIAPTEANAALMGDMRLRPDDMTDLEMEAFAEDVHRAAQESGNDPKA